MPWGPHGWQEEPENDNGADAPKPGESLGDSAPKLSDLQNQPCPNCTVGVLYVTRYDPEALHEKQQGAALAKGRESGGAYDVHCLSCDFSESRALNPGEQHGTFGADRDYA